MKIGKRFQFDKSDANVVETKNDLKKKLIFLKLNGKTVRHFGFCLFGKKQENCSLNISTKNVGSTSTCIHGYISYAMIFCIYGKWKASN